MRFPRVIAVALLCSGALAACGGGGGDDKSGSGGAKLQAAGDVKVDVGGSGGSGTTTTVPVAKGESGPAILELGSAWTAFRQCVKDAGFGNEPLPSSVEDTKGLDPAYLDALGKCNNETGIVDALTAFQKESKTLDPKQIEQQNAGLIAFRKCVLRRGWLMGELKPNESGALFPSGQAPEPPEGRDSKRDYEECAKAGADAATDVAAKQEKDAGDNG